MDRHPRILGNCARCGKECLLRTDRISKFCSHACATASKGLTLSERLLKYVRVLDTGCWLWTGSLDSKGYGQINFNGKICRAHRLSYVVYKGTIPPGKEVCHHCDFKWCICPDCLFLGTHLENLQDAARKGLVHSGEEHGMAKLTGEQVMAIRLLACRAELTQREIGDRFGIVASHVSMIKTGRSWSHL
jgi:HNH endonuclease